VGVGPKHYTNGNEVPKKYQADLMETRPASPNYTLELILDTLRNHE
jgi:hypothetical protein